MAKTKLKSVFTREDVYTVLQLLKALADGVDDNEALTDEDIKKLQDKVLTSVTVVSVDSDHKKIILTFADNTTIESVPFESGNLPQGYEVDSTGKVIINKALTAVSEGDVEVRNNLIIDGKAKLNSIADLIDNDGNQLIKNTSQFITIKSKADADKYINKIGLYLSTSEQFGSILVVGKIHSATEASFKVNGIIISGYNGKAFYNNDYYSGGNIAYDGTFYSTSSSDDEIPGTNTVKQLIKQYWHTVRIQGANGNFAFSAPSTHNTPINTEQNLVALFKGDVWAGFGTFGAKFLLELDLSGESITFKVSDGTSISLGSFGTLDIYDNVKTVH